MDAPKDVGDRQLDALLERLDRLTAEVHGLNRRLDSGDNLAPIVRELGLLNESLQTLAYAALGQSGPQVQRRRREDAGLREPQHLRSAQLKSTGAREEPDRSGPARELGR